MRMNQKVLVATLVALLGLQGLLQRVSIFPYWSKYYSTRQEGMVEGLGPDQILFVLGGFRELVSGILWVKADSFFNTGNYDAILPIIRIVTFLDPKNLDVYSTGMWHIAYNFTDEDQRSDRRYIPSALALGAEGAKNNPATYELFFETAWLWYHKIDDFYPNAVSWMDKALQRKDMPPARANLYANILQRDGQIEKALEHYYRRLDLAETAIRQSPTFTNNSLRDTVENNIDTMLVRMAQRGNFARKRNEYSGGGYDTENPFDVGLSARVTVVEPQIILIEGTWNVLPVGTRIRVVLRDADLRGAIPGGMDWNLNNGVVLDPPRDVTFMQDQLFVRNRRFSRRIEMVKDPTMYPFRKPDYVIEFYYNARSAPAHIQDKFGWNGEGMTDKNYLNESIRPGQRVIFATLRMTRDQLLRLGDWSMEGKTPVVQTPNYKVPLKTTEGDADVIQVPGLRAGS